MTRRGPLHYSEENGQHSNEDLYWKSPEQNVAWGEASNLVVIIK